MRSVIAALVGSLAILPIPGLAEDIYTPRRWTGRNGNTLNGSFCGFSDDRKSLHIGSSNRTFTAVAFDSLSEADQKWLLQKHLVTGDPSAPLAWFGKPEEFRPVPEIDRGRLPVINQSKLGKKESDCVPSAFCNFVLWWDATGVLEIPKKGDPDDKAEWIHSRLAGYCRTRNTAGTGTSEAFDGFRKYFDKDLEGVATLRYRVDHDVTPGNLARYTVGANATMLDLSIMERNRFTGGHWVALQSADPGGRVVFVTWGARFEGQIKVHEDKPKAIKVGNQLVPATSYEIHVSNPEQLPESIRNSRRRFILDPARWDGIHVVKPLIYLKQGGNPLPPRDQLFDGPLPAAAKP